MPAYIFVGCIGIASILFYRQIIHFVLRDWLLLVFPLLCVTSTLWSDDPTATFRHSTQLLITFVAALIIARTLSPSTFVGVVCAATSLLILLSLPGAPAAIKSKSALLGIFDSKNALGYMAQLLFVASVSIVFLPKISFIWRLIASPFTILSIITIVLTQSAGAIVSTAVAVLCLILGGVYLAVPKRYRSLALATSILALLPVGWFLPSLQDWWEQFQARALHKDASLTGRTYLWDFGHRLIAERPWIGHGTASFWRHGNIDAEGLWRKFDIFNRSGFNFHNIFIEILVGNGYVGLTIVIIMIVAIGFRLVLAFISRPTRDKLFFIGYIAAIYAGMRTESGLIGPFDFYTVIWLAASVYSTRSRSPRALSVSADSRPVFERRSPDAGLAPDDLRGTIGAPS